MGTVKIFAEHEEVNPGKPDYDGRTPLSYATEIGYRGIAEILVKCQEVNPQKPDNSGRTPLIGTRVVPSMNEGTATGPQSYNPQCDMSPRNHRPAKSPQFFPAPAMFLIELVFRIISSFAGE